MKLPRHSGHGFGIGARAVLIKIVPTNSDSRSPGEATLFAE
ncbi:MAG: hypothetical protein AAF892_09860 [Cyanobacteria bacterium P01_D01_bin.71]